MPLPARPASPRTLGEATAQLDRLWDTLGKLHERHEALQGQYEELAEQLRELQERAGKSSRNSSRPPSSDSPSQRGKRRSRGRSARRRGAQPGHTRHERPLLEESRVDERHDYFPDGQCGCGGVIAIDAEASCRHQVFDLPEVRARVTEHRLFGGQCAECAARHVARAPASVPSGQMGPGLIAWIALMGGEMHLSVRQIQRLLAEQWNLAFSTGAISEAQGKASEALAMPYKGIADHVRGSPVAHADETPHPRGGCREHSRWWWMWILTTGLVSFFGVNFSRGKGAAAALLGEFGGTLVTDDLGSYSVVPSHRRQLCWAHLIRHFIAMAERRGSGGKIGRRLLLIGQAVIRTHHRLEDERIEEPIYRRRMQRLRRSLRETLERGSRLRLDGRTKRQCVHLLGRESMLWSFMGDRRIGLTNNVAERGLRPYVIWRKLAFASHSRRGDHFRARILSVGTTARQLRVPLYAYLRRVCTEAFEPEGVRTMLPLDTPPRALPTS